MLKLDDFKKAKWKVDLGLRSASIVTDNYCILYCSDNTVYVTFFKGSIKEMQIYLDDISTVEEIESTVQEMYKAIIGI